MRKYDPPQVGTKYGRWTIVANHVVSPKWKSPSLSSAKAYARCECGTERLVDMWALRAGESTSCGCFNRDVSRAQATHGHVRGGKASRTYRIWMHMKGRCLNPKEAQYAYYGGRGITLDPKWLEFTSFLADMGVCPPGKEIDRIDSDGSYTKDNCRWATRGEQLRNTRRNVWLTVKEETLCLKDWANRMGVNQNLIRKRLHLGWPVEDAVLLPSHGAGAGIPKRKRGRTK